MSKISYSIPLSRSFSSWPDEYREQVIKKEIERIVISKMYEILRDNKGYLLIGPLEIEMPVTRYGIDFGFALTRESVAEQDNMIVSLRYNVVEEKVDNIVRVETSTKYVDRIKKLSFKERIIYLVKGELPIDAGYIP